MKTLPQIAEEHLRKYHVTISGPEAFSQIIELNARQNEKVVRRVNEDQALKAVAFHFASTTNRALQNTSESVRDTLLFTAFVQAIQDWEEVNEKFYAQLRPQPQVQ